MTWRALLGNPQEKMERMEKTHGLDSTPNSASESRVATCWHDLLQCKSIQDTFVVLKEFRNSGTTEGEIIAAYRVQGVLLRFFKGQVQDHVTPFAPGFDNKAKPIALTADRAGAFVQTFGCEQMLWDQFWLWAKAQVLAGADAQLLVESEAVMQLALRTARQKRKATCKKT